MVDGKEKEKAGQGGDSGGRKKPPGLRDERFSAMHSDPRFSRFPKNKNKLEIDQRFAGMFKDPEFQAKAAVDKRGRKVKPSQKSDELRSFYRLKDEDEWRQDKAEGGVEVHAKKDAPAKSASAKQSEKVVKAKAQKGKQQQQAGDGGDVEAAGGGTKAGGDAEQQQKPDKKKLQAEDASEDEGEEEDEDVDSEEEAARHRFMRARGMLDASSSSDDGGVDEDGGAKDGEAESGSSDEDESDEEESEAEEEELDASEWGAGAMANNPQEEIPLLDETRRFAVVDLDWDHVRAVDIYAVLSSFKPPDGEVKRVTVYPSDYGLERMAEESSLGPQRIFKPKEPKGKKKTSGGGEDADEGGEDEEEEGDDDEQESDEESELDRKRLAMYERSKLRYYYAVVECDTISTALHIYNECDGLEFERSACKFDIRFVPDEQSFKDRAVRDAATSIPSGYEPPTIFNMSLQHTDPKLTWDADDDSRKKVLNRKLTEEEVKDADFAAYLGSEEEEEEDRGEGVRQEENPESLRERYRSLLLSGVDANGKSRTKAGSWGAGAGDSADDEGESGDDDEEEEKEEGGGLSHLKTRTKGHDGVDMEVTFIPGLEGLGDKLLAKKREEESRRGETVWETYLRNRKERKKAKKAKTKGRQVDSSSSESEDFGEELKDHMPGKQVDEGAFDDPFFKDADDDFDAFANNVDSEEEDDEDLVGSKGRREKKDAVSKEGGKKTELSKVEKKAAALEERKKAGELELLLMDDSALRDVSRGAGAKALRAAARGADEESVGLEAGKKLSKKEKREAKKQLRRAARENSDEEDIRVATGRGGPRKGGEEDELAAGFEVNLDDPRFSEMFSSSLFALDPTDPRFAKTKDSETLMKKISKKRAKVLQQQQQQQQEEQKKLEKETSKAATAEDNGSSKDGALQSLEMRAMVSKMKRKAEMGSVSMQAAAAAQADRRKKPSF